MASGGADGVVRLWNLATGQPADDLPTSCESPLHAVAFSSDGTLLTSADDDGVVHRWALRGAGGQALSRAESRHKDRNHGQEQALPADRRADRV
ncbi:hypothetical protein OHB00_49205 [Streptomyces sp. NBC_00631]|uniref:WD40 repeat domain-containing protein n=1 Tax=Streptomyces sp. NBC_00631 TaxID=2975793 RepID=UPI0030E30025